MLCSDSEVKSHVGGGVSFTRLNPIHTCTTVSHTKTPFTQFPTVLMPMSHAHLKAGFQCGGLIFKHMYDMFTRESESMHTPFSVTIFYFYICNLIGPFTYAKATSPIYTCINNKTRVINYTCTGNC